MMRFVQHDARTHEGRCMTTNAVRLHRPLGPIWLVLLLLGALGLGASSAAWATHDGYHRYAVGREDNGYPYYGIEVRRWDNTWNNIPNDGCSSPITGHPTYQTQWIIYQEGGWIELGTGHQCNGNFRYWFWGWAASDGVFNLRGWREIPGTQPNVFRIWYTGSGTWHWEIDSTRLASLSSSRTSGRIEAGIESYSSGASRTLHNYELLRYRRSQGYWVDWAGKDGRVVNAGMCGSFVGDTTWRAGQGSGC